MSNAITALQAALAVIFDLLWRPLQLLGVGYQLVLVAIIFGIVMVLLYGRISKQAAIKRVKNEIAAGLIEVVLFRRDIQISLRAQGLLLLAGMRYFLLAMGPVLILAIPFTIIFGHLNLRLGARPFAVGEEGVLGKFPLEVIGDRTNKWSADHCFDPALVPGVILSNKTEWKQGPCGIWDLAPSILASFGLPVPPEMDGTPILKA
ncbi:MAG: hypothetical protein NTV65_10690 [Proteobacteria bacterium]|nr:hypothetical protein [Pseudomonadota bacterium]